MCYHNDTFFRVVIFTFQGLHPNPIFLFFPIYIMELNRLIPCFALWIAAELILLGISIYRFIKNLRLNNARKLYMQRLIYFLKKGVAYEKLLNKIYLSILGVKNTRILQKNVFQAINTIDFQIGLELIQEKMGCYPIMMAHEGILLKKDRKEIINESLAALVEWEEALKELRLILLRNRFIVLFEKMIFFFMNITLYIYLQSDLSMVIFIVVNTISVIWSILLQDESIRVIGEDGERNLATIKSAKKRTQAPAFRCKQLYQLVGAMGLIINISMIAVRYLEQVV